MTFMRRKLLLLVIMILYSTNANASGFKGYLDYVSQEFDQAVELDQKNSMVSRRVSYKELKNLENKEACESDYKNILATSVSSDYSGMQDSCNSLSIAISLGNVRTFKKLSTHILNINDDRLATWGYRQGFTLAHVALNPLFPHATDNVSIEDRLEIIDILADKKANFNDCYHKLDQIKDSVNFRGGIYTNPPLTASYAIGAYFGNT